MYIDLKPCLTSRVDKIDLQSLKQYDSKGNVFFSCYDSIYYPKTTNLNELIGEELANQINLNTVSYKLFEDVNGEIFIASKSFIKPTCIYYNPLDFEKHFQIYNHLENWELICKDKENYECFLESIFKLFSIDIYMKQNDRWNSNIQIEKYDTGYVDLAPIYDYSESMWYESSCYHNTFHSFSHEWEYGIFFNRYPKLLETLKKIKKVEMQKVLENIEFQKDIVINTEIKDIYLRREEISQKKLEKIIK